MPDDMGSLRLQARNKRLKTLIDALEDYLQWVLGNDPVDQSSERGVELQEALKKARQGDF